MADCLTDCCRSTTCQLGQVLLDSRIISPRERCGAAAHGCSVGYLWSEERHLHIFDVLHYRFCHLQRCIGCWNNARWPNSARHWWWRHSLSQLDHPFRPCPTTAPSQVHQLPATVRVGRLQCCTHHRRSPGQAYYLALALLHQFAVLCCRTCHRTFRAEVPTTRIDHQ